MAPRKVNREIRTLEEEARLHAVHKPGALVWVKIPKRGRPSRKSNPKGDGPYKVLEELIGCRYSLDASPIHDDEYIVSARHLYPYEPEDEDLQDSRTNLFQEGENDAGASCQVLTPLTKSSKKRKTIVKPSWDWVEDEGLQSKEKSDPELNTRSRSNDAVAHFSLANLEEAWQWLDRSMKIEDELC